MEEFPILERAGGKFTIPWELIAQHEEQALKNHGQTLKRLAERGGLSFCEALAVLEDRQWRKVDNAWINLAAYVLRYKCEQKNKEGI